MNYYISDLHLFARSQIDNGGRNYDGRPYKTLEEMHDDILKRWNKFAIIKNCLIHMKAKVIN